MSGPPSIAACLMVRNEAAHLRRCLDSVRGQVSAIYVTDTGSTDDTVAVARSFGAEVRNFPWGDDFAAARNASLEGVREDWMLCLDADDVFPPGEAAKLGQGLAENACAATVRYAVIADYAPVRSLKLIRNRQGARFEGIIHENVRGWLRRKTGQGWVRQDLAVDLIHEGYSPEAIPGKMARNLPLLVREWDRCRQDDDREQRLHVGAELGLALAHRGQPEAGAAQLMNLWQEVSDTAASGALVSTLQVFANLLWVLEGLGREVQALEICRRAESRLGAQPVYQWQRGLAELAAGNHARALQSLETLPKAGEKMELDAPLPAEASGAGLWRRLGLCHMGLRNHEQARLCFQRCVELDPDNPEHQLRLRVAQSMMAT